VELIIYKRRESEAHIEFRGGLGEGFSWREDLGLGFISIGH